jgi:hypothetical protein
MANQGVVVSKDGRVRMQYDMTIGNTKLDFYVDGSTLVHSVILDSDLFNMYYEDIKKGVENRTYNEIVVWARNIEFYIKLHIFCMRRKVPKFDLRSLLRRNTQEDDLQNALMLAFVRAYAVSELAGLKNILQYNVYNILSECEKVKANGVVAELPYGLVAKKVLVQNEKISVSLSKDDVIGIYLSIGKRLFLRVSILNKSWKSWKGSISLSMLRKIRKHLMLLARCMYIPIQDNILEEWRNIFLMGRVKLESSVLKEVLKDGRDKK